MIGIIFALTSKTNEQEKYEERLFETQKNQYKSTTNVSISNEIETLESLRSNNIISADEFVRLKNKIIDSNIGYKNTNDDIQLNTESNTTNNKNFPPYGNENFKQGKTNYLIYFIVASVVIIIFFVINTCENNSKEEINNDTISTEQINQNSDKIESIYKSEEIILKNFSYEDVARYAMATSMQEPVNIIKAEKRKDYYYVYYVRKSDSQKFDYKVKFEGNSIIWGDINGRWQDTKYDEKISFEEIGNKLNIQYLGESVEYKKGDLFLMK